MEDARIEIPMLASDRSVVIFPDELPPSQSEKYIDLIDVFRSELAPLKVWRNCAIEYHRQGFDEEFDMVLNEIVSSLNESNVEIIYRERDDYTEGITDIYLALAAKSLSKLIQSKNDQTIDPGDCARKVVEYLNLVDDKLRLNDYSWLIKGLYEVVQGDLKRAEDHFRNVYDRANSKSTHQGHGRRFIFGATLGLGLVAYHRAKYGLAADMLSKAIMQNPNCSASVRVSLACCCFKLEQYDRARLAVQRAIAMEPSNANALLLMALLDQVSARTDRSNRLEFRRSAFEYCLLARTLDSNNPTTLNLLANHYFHTWVNLLSAVSTAESSFSAGAAATPASTMVGACYAVNDHHLLMAQSLVTRISSSTQFRINGDPQVFRITELLAQKYVSRFMADMQRLGVTLDLAPEDYVVVKLDRRMSAEGVRAGEIVSRLEGRDLNTVLELAQRALDCSSLPETRAESFYMLGKVNHVRNDSEIAFEMYKRSLRELPDMVLAASGAAQVLLSRQEFAPSLELFEKVLQKNPDDKDTQAYVMFLKAIHRKEDTQYEKLREIVPGFQFEIDLWLIQGQLKQKNTLEHLNALKCYMHAKDGMDLRKLPIPATVVSNIAVLNYSIGQLAKALEFSKLAILHAGASGKNALSPEDLVRRDRSVLDNPIMKNEDFAGVFFSWSQSVATVTYVSDSVSEAPGSTGNIYRFMLQSSASDGLLLDSLLSKGDEVMISDIKMRVTDAGPREITCTCIIPLVGLLEAQALKGATSAGEASGAAFPLCVKAPYENFTDHTTTYCFNYARLLEDMGMSRSAGEIYIELLKRHPSFIECYLRLSMLSCDIGKYDDASVWLARALAVSDDEPDASICLGDLYVRGKHWEEAKRSYEKICSKNKHDGRAMLALGNMYYVSSSGSGIKADSHLKDSYKFFHHVLNEDKKNVYAANGLGMVCAAKNELDLAREIFSRAREANMPVSEDICGNLANVNLMQQRFLDAEHLYQASISSLSTCGRSHYEKAANTCECMAFAQLKSGRPQDATQALMRALHYSPMNLRDWYNIALAHKNDAMSMTKKATKRVHEISRALDSLIFAVRVYGHLCTLSGQKQFDKKSAGSLRNVCQANLISFQGQLSEAQAEEERLQALRQVQQEKHAELQRSREMSRLHELETIERQKLDKQQLVAEKEKKLKELTEKWVAAPVVQPKTSGKTKGGKRQRADAAEGGELEAEEHAGEDGERYQSVIWKDKATLKESALGDIDFGSSDEDASVPEKRSAAMARAPVAKRMKRLHAADLTVKDKSKTDEDDLFGSDDDSDAEADGGTGFADGTGSRRRVVGSEDEEEENA